MQLNEYITLGRSGLIVSPLALGTMTFGNDRWGSDDAESTRIFDRYVEGGGNFMDVADVYAEGKSEEVLGRFIADAGLRDKLVLATKFTFNPQEGNPNAGGNGRKISIARWRARCADCRLTTSISTGCTCGTR